MAPSTSEDYWQNYGQEEEATRSFLNQVVAAAETGADLENAARAIAGFGPKFIVGLDMIIRNKIVERVKKLSNSPGSTPALAEEAGRLGTAWRLVDSTHP